MLRSARYVPAESPTGDTDTERLWPPTPVPLPLIDSHCRVVTVVVVMLDEGHVAPAELAVSYWME